MCRLWTSGMEHGANRLLRLSKIFAGILCKSLVGPMQKMKARSKFKKRVMRRRTQIIIGQVKIHRDYIRGDNIFLFQEFITSTDFKAGLYHLVLERIR